MKNNIKKILSSRFWFVFPTFSIFINDNVLLVIFWIIVLVTFSLAYAANYKSKVNQAEVN
ncbi:hypothetical protein [Clostridium sp. C8-1-8]|uniref:hypothetical protein n=1 Tax=Clostridium sp. C8-1-8 TaxID=2698831 RepID=UPI001371D0BD|nr:hypothetical protein [Clostridium sp. C8-1-8]